MAWRGAAVWFEFSSFSLGRAHPRVGLALAMQPLASTSKILASSIGMGSMEKDRLSSIPPFPPNYRASGVLRHVTSLPSRYGAGDVGPTVMQWVDLLDDAGQSWWQSLPPGLAWSSTAGLAIAPLQDLLSLGAEARMNVPGQSGGNWA